MILAEYFVLHIHFKFMHFCTFTARMEMLLRGNLRRGVGLCLLLLALVHEATGQRRKTGRKNNNDNNRLHDDGGTGDYYLYVGGEGLTVGVTNSR